MYQVSTYTSADFEAWNAFVAQSRNGTFLFHRHFMEYHADRFHDASLCVEKNGQLCAVLPAHRVDEALYSHYGLTYGGLVLAKGLHFSEVLAIFKALLAYAEAQGFATLFLKEIPPFYCCEFNGDIAYLMQLCSAKIHRADLLATVNLRQPLTISKTRRESIRRGQKKGLTIVEESNFEAFWNTLLIPNLRDRHQTQPVHSLAEITYLHQKFPQHIRHFNVYEGTQLVAGTTVFDTGRVAHPQYVAADQRRSETGALDFLYHHLMTEVYAQRDVFDFGISNENQGKQVNSGLQFWKESYGAQPVVQHYYQVPTAQHTQLSQVLL
ncbi:GNAT family N-acetyltransferase [Flavobacterium sp.]|uniref:GNAT family N-acetyltransferase n=1 Tax=Flavobacterium sp. TaxID=239 RepID=UPI0022C33B64|nr:GNAT family N-acetyltransferase [Flavobacterium sp.]MCZ8144819.1 GNAT family N-acetyltransferase [Flavobacterium sp.]MCZ8366735.1 GNAT family N-acetyltransferase [Flavobacterium sp.]